MGYVTTIRLSDKTKVQIEKLKESLTTRQAVIETAINYYYGDRSIESIEDDLYRIIGMTAVIVGVLLRHDKQIFIDLREGKYQMCMNMLDDWACTIGPEHCIQALISSVRCRLSKLRD